MDFNAWKSSLVLIITLLLFFIETVTGLECYACTNQDTNKDKCIKTSIQCEEHQDICWTETRWGLPPYWTPYGDRMHYVFKGCDTKVSCEYQKQALMPKCKRDWYDDWTCHECCSGDLCNYYATLGANGLSSSVTIVVASLTTVLLVLRQYL